MLKEKKYKKKKLSEFERYKKRMERRRKIRILAWITLITVLSGGIVIGLRYMNGVNFTGINTELNSTEEFPRPLSGGRTRQMETVGWNIAVLTDSALQIVNSKGTELLNVNHGCANPVMKTSGDRILLYDQGGTKYQIFSGAKPVHTGSVEMDLHAAAIASDGTFVLGGSSTKYTTQISIYNRDNSLADFWTASNMVSSLAISPDARRLAICLLGAKDGAALTTVSLLDLHDPESKKVVSVEAPEEFGYQVAYQGQTLTLLTDKGIRAIDSDSGRVRNRYDFGGQQVRFYARGGSDVTVLVLGNYRYMRTSELIALNTRCEVLGKQTLNLGMDAVKADDKGIYYLTGGTLVHCALDCKTVLSRTDAPDIINILPSGQEVYAVTYEELKKLNVK